MIKDISAQLVRKENLAGDVWGFTFEIQDDSIEFTPGQYMLLKIGDAFRQYSISSTNKENGFFEFIIEFFPGGLASTYLTELSIGDNAEFKGPAGVFTLQETDKDKFFIVTGTGIAPVKSMIDSYLSSPGTAELYLLFGLKTRKDMYLFEHFKELADSHQNFDFDTCLSREESLDRLDQNHVALGRVNQVWDVMVEEEGYDVNSFEYYLCGSKEIVESLKEYIAGKGVSAENIFFENFG